jgi:chemotaxis protein MotB
MKKSLCALAAAALLCGCVSSRKYALVEKESGDARKGLSEAQARLSDTQAKLSDAQARLSDTQAKLAASQAKVDEDGKALEASKSGASDLDKRLAASQAQGVDLQARLAASESRAAELQGGLQRLTERAEGLDKERERLGAANASLSESLNARQDELSKTISKLQADLGEAQKSLGQAQAKSADYEALSARQQRQLDEQAARAAQLDKEIAQLKKANADLSLSLNAKQDELSKTVSSLSRDNRGLESLIADINRGAEELKARQAREISETKATYESMVGALRQEIEKGQVKITQIEGKLSVNVADTIFFDSGKADIKESGRSVLRRLGDILSHLTDKQIRVEGHTDNVPIRGSLKEKYPTNWELSTARATQVARFLQEKAGMDPSLISAAGFAEHRPIAPNDSEEGRSKNRRIEILLLDKAVR